MGILPCMLIWALVINVKQQSGEAREAVRCIVTALPNNIEDTECEGTAQLDGDLLNLVHVNSESEYAAVVGFVSSMFPHHPTKDHGSNGSCSEVIGVVGDLDSKTASIIHTLASRSNLSITLVAAVAAPSNFLPVTNLALPNLLDMRPLSHYIEGLVEFLDILNWTRIGLVTDDTYYYQFAAELLQKRLLNHSTVITPFVRIKSKNGYFETLQTFKLYETRIIVVSMDSVSACAILEEAQKHNFTWPDYSVILLDFLQSKCPRISYVEGVIILEERDSMTNSENSSNEGASLRVRSFAYSSSQSFSSTLYDSILAVILADNLNFLNTTFAGVNGHVKVRDNKRLSNINFAQIINSTRQDIAYYDSHSQQLVMLPNTSLTTGTIPRGTTLIIVYRPSVLHTVLLIMAYIFCTAFTTVVFILYVYFRKEPEIKATSVTVSLCMFLGCYLLLLFVPVLHIDAQPVSHLAYPAEFFCILIPWLSLLGIPLTLILATLFVKMLRVYMIFCTPHSYKRRLFSNPMLFLYIVLLTSPSFIFLLLWSCIDTFTNTLLEVSERSRVLQFERCESSNTIIWLSLLHCYTHHSFDDFGI